MNKNLILHVGGKKAFESILQNIKNSTKSIEINMFIWRDDYIGNLIAKELHNAANRNIKITISKDKLGSLFELSEENRQSFFNKKLDIFIYMKALFLNLFYPMKNKRKNQKQLHNILFLELINHKNIEVSYNITKGDHSKYYIFDNKILIMGGINIEDKELNTDVEGKSYHDYMIEINSTLCIEKFKNQINNNQEINLNSEINFIKNSKDNNIYEMKNHILNLLNSSTNKIDIVMAYLGNTDIEKKIIELANKGIKIVLIISSKSNLQQDLNIKILKRILYNTNNLVEVYLSPQMVHSKLIRIDNEIVTVGSTNLNNQALNTLSELNATILLNNKDFKNELEKSIINQIEISKRIFDYSELKYNKIKAIIENIV